MASKFSKRHYIQIAEILRDHLNYTLDDKNDKDDLNFQSLINEFIVAFKQDNGNFNSNKFETAIYK